MKCLAEKHSDNWSLYHGDACEVIKGLPDSSIDLCIHSPPFSTLYIYSDSEADMGNCKDDAEFIQHYEFLIAELFRVQGEAHFRALERAALEQVLAARDAPVVALGGGALLHRPTRLRALRQAVVISLQADSAEIARRIAAAGPTRPLANAEARESLEILLAEREEAYAEAHARLSTDTLSIDDAAAQALAIWQRDPIAVAAMLRAHDADALVCGHVHWGQRFRVDVDGRRRDVVVLGAWETAPSYAELSSRGIAFVAWR